MKSMRPDKDICVEKIRIAAEGRTIPALVLTPKSGARSRACVLWIHGGGYISGMKEMVHMSRAVELVKDFGVTVVSPGYRLALFAPYHAALEDCYAALLHIKNNADALGIDERQIMVGGESAGGGLTAAAREDGAFVDIEVRGKQK